MSSHDTESLRAENRRLYLAIGEWQGRAERAERDLSRARDEARQAALNHEAALVEALDERTRRIVELVRDRGTIAAMGDVNPDDAQLYEDLADQIEGQFPR